MDNFFVEIIVRVDKTSALYSKLAQERKDAQDDLLEDLHSFMVFESDDKIVFNVPITWVGFKNGTIISMVREFNDSMYVALAYFSLDENEFVTDFDGKLIDAYETTYNGRSMNKFVKKRIQIVEFIDKAKDVFSVQRYILDLKFTDPVMKVMDLYSDASNGGISSKDFIK